jgi:glycosyltransferase involved in cell wall biosynthesis
MRITSFNKLINIAELIIVNTLALHSIVMELSNFNINILWWIHEGKFAYDIFANKIYKKLNSNIKVFTVGKYAAQFWNRLETNIRAQVMLYGIKDKYEDNNKVYSKDKIIFSLIGTIDRRKGQDIFVKAVKLIPNEYRNEAEFWIIGKTIDKEYKNQLDICASEIEEIKFFDEMNNDLLFDVYNKSSVIVSTSRDDPMPIVLSEGMMMKKTCICSSNTGTAALIKNWDNGVVFKAEDYEELRNIIMKMISNNSILKVMGENARTTYEENFMYSTFKFKFMDEIRKIL